MTSYRFKKKSEQRRPTELAKAHASFEVTYAALFSETHYRTNYAAVLGFDEPRWTLVREKKCVDVLLELMACGVIPIDKLDLGDWVVLPKISFLPFVPATLDPIAKRLRFSEVPLEIPFWKHPHVSVPTEHYIPRPAWSTP